MIWYSNRAISFSSGAQHHLERLTFDGQGVEVDLLDGLDLSSLDQSSELGHWDPLLLTVVLSTTTSASTTTATTSVSSGTSVTTSAESLCGCCCCSSHSSVSHISYYDNRLTKALPRTTRALRLSEWYGRGFVGSLCTVLLTLVLHSYFCRICRSPRMRNFESLSCCLRRDWIHA